MSTDAGPGPSEVATDAGPTKPATDAMSTPALTDSRTTQGPTDDGKTMGSTDVLETSRLTDAAVTVAKTSPTTDTGSGIFDSTTTEAPVVTSGISTSKVPSQATESGKIFLMILFSLLTYVI